MRTLLRLLRSHFMPAATLCIALTIASDAQTLSTLVNFDGTNGANAGEFLIQSADGEFYGTTTGGGISDPNCYPDGCGTVFKITPDGNLTTLHKFDISDGFEPNGLLQASDGNFYGTTHSGGPNSAGTVFELTVDGTFTTLYSFCSQPGCSDGQSPSSALVQGADGSLYGTTVFGGAYGPGTIFKITTTGALTVLYSFAGADGAQPQSALVQAADGSFYGVTNWGGSGGGGTVFKFNPGGALTTLHNFSQNGNNGYWPFASLVQANDGNFYGSTAFGGTGACGTLFKITPGGTLTIVHTFTGLNGDGKSPYAPLIQATDGNLYGTTQEGGTTGLGNVFQVTPTGTVTTLYSFCVHNNCADGDEPSTALIQATDGSFYGGTTWGGAGGDGTIFRLSTGLPPFVETRPTIGQAGAPVTILGTNLSGATNVTFNGTPATINSNTGSAITTTVPAGATTGVVQVTLPSGTLNSNTNFQVTGPLQFIPVSPCRLVDTRQSGGAIQGGTSRNFTVPQLGDCGIPAGAAAYSLNVTVVPNNRALGYLTIWPEGEIQPFVSTMNSSDGRTKANAVIVPSGNSAVSVYVTNTTDVLLDINGYFASATEGSLQFYPLTPCRVVDTRGANGNLGGPYLQAQVERDFPVLESSCIPSGVNVAAYSMNFTAVPHPAGQPLGYLTVWPKGETQPVVSTLNNPTATVVANAAIVPAGTDGSFAVYPYNTTDLIVDINGYFAAPGQNGLSLYPVAPCRVIDTRNNNGQPFTGEKTVDVVGSPCAPPSNGLAYIFNATVAPPGQMPYLTLWPDGQQQPTVSTLNANDGLVTSNMAIVPTTNGSIDAYAAGLTQLILDISGYFAP